jgi:hypothetical protein
VLPDPFIPENLKERSLLRKIGKKLGLKRGASAQQVLREIGRQVELKAAADKEAATRGTVLPPAPDLARLQAALDQAVALRPVASSASPRKPAALALPDALQALQVAQADPTGGIDGAGPVKR